MQVPKGSVVPSIPAYPSEGMGSLNLSALQREQAQQTQQWLEQTQQTHQWMQQFLRETNQ